MKADIQNLSAIDENSAIIGVDNNKNLSKNENEHAIKNQSSSSFSKMIIPAIAAILSFLISFWFMFTNEKKTHQN